MTGYRERLRVPLRWWVQAVMFLATVWLACLVATPLWLANLIAGLLLALTLGLLGWIGSARVEVTAAALIAGRAHISLEHLGEVEPLGTAETRDLLGPGADARAYLLTRPYLHRAVRVQLTDPADPTPYWVLSSRHPERLAAALRAATASPAPGHSD